MKMWNPKFTAIREIA